MKNMYRFLFLTLSILLSGLSFTGYSQESSLPTPKIIEIKEDDRVATVFWNTKKETYSLPYNQDVQNGVHSFRVEWSEVGGSFEKSIVTPYRAIMLQPLTPGVQYKVRIYALGKNGEKSTPSETKFFEHSSARVDSMRMRLNGFFTDFNLPMGAFPEEDWNQAYTGCADLDLRSQHINQQFHAHNVVKSQGCDRAGASSRLRHKFDFRNRTGIIEFDSDGSKKARQLWYLDISPFDRKRDMTGHVSFLAGNGDPAYMLRIQEVGTAVQVFLANSLGDLLPLPNQYNNNACGGDLPYCQNENLFPISNLRRHWRIELSKTRIRIFIEKDLVTDASLICPQAPDGLPYEEAQINWLFFSYNTTKENLPAAMIHWDNFGIDAPAGYQQTTVIHNYTDGTLGTKSPQIGNDPSNGLVAKYDSPGVTTIPIPDELKDKDGNKPISTELMFCLQGSEYKWTNNDEVLVNGHSYSFPKPTSSIPNYPETHLINSIAPYSAILNISTDHLIKGNNKIEFKLNNIKVLNIHIEIMFPKDKAPNFTQPIDIFPSHEHDLMHFHHFLENVGPGILYDKVEQISIFDGNEVKAEIDPISGRVTAFVKQSLVTKDTLKIDVLANSTPQLVSKGTALGIAYYEILIDKKVVKTVYTNKDFPVAGFLHENVEVPLTNLANGPHELFLKAYDIAGNVSTLDAFETGAYPDRYVPYIFQLERLTSTDNENTEKEPFVIFPNPTTGTLYISGPEELAGYEITNILGARIASESTNNKTIILKNPSSGLIFITIQTKSGTKMTKKIVVY